MNGSGLRARAPAGGAAGASMHLDGSALPALLPTHCREATAREILTAPYGEGLGLSSRPNGAL